MITCCSRSPPQLVHLRSYLRRLGVEDCEPLVGLPERARQSFRRGVFFSRSVRGHGLPIMARLHGRRHVRRVRRADRRWRSQPVAKSGGNAEEVGTFIKDIATEAGNANKRFKKETGRNLINFDSKTGQMGTPEQVVEQVLRGTGGNPFAGVGAVVAGSIAKELAGAAIGSAVKTAILKMLGGGGGGGDPVPKPTPGGRGDKSSMALGVAGAVLFGFHEAGSIGNAGEANIREGQDAATADIHDLMGYTDDPAEKTRRAKQIGAMLGKSKGTGAAGYGESFLRAGEYIVNDLFDGRDVTGGKAATVDDAYQRTIQANAATLHKVMRDYQEAIVGATGDLKAASRTTPMGSADPSSRGGAT
jgi:hypothetical protein